MAGDALSTGWAGDDASKQTEHLPLAAAVRLITICRFVLGKSS